MTSLESVRPTQSKNICAHSDLSYDAKCNNNSKGFKVPQLPQWAVCHNHCCNCWLQSTTITNFQLFLDAPSLSPHTVFMWFCSPIWLSSSFSHCIIKATRSHLNSYKVNAKVQLLHITQPFSSMILLVTKLSKPCSVGASTAQSALTNAAWGHPCWSFSLWLTLITVLTNVTPSIDLSLW